MGPVQLYIAGQRLSSDKDVVVSTMLEHFKAIYNGDANGPSYEAPYLTITGEPGAGKTHLMKTLRKISDMLEVGEQLRAAFMGIAGVNVDGQSLCSFLDMPINESGKLQRIRPWNKDKLHEFKLMHDVDRISCMIIDEISTSSGEILTYAHERLMEATAKNKLFGGLAMILVGDFDQMPPAVAEAIPITVMKLERSRNWRNRYSHDHRDLVTGARNRGANFFTMARHMRLTSQHRSVDADQTAFIRKMSQGDTVTKEDLKKLYKLLGEGPGGDKEFRFAPVIVSGNFERMQTNYYQSLQWVKVHETKLVRWPRKIKDWKGGPTTPGQVHHAIENNPCFWEYFVSKALGFLNYNINTLIKMANGSIISYHSLSFLDNRELQHFSQMMENTPDGGIVSLSDPPDFINVELFPDQEGQSKSETQKNKKLREWWKWGSIPNDEKKIIVPIACKGWSHIKSRSEVVSSSGGKMRYKPSRALLQDYFPIELGFAITIYKCQGRTIYKVILSLSQHPEEKLRFIWEGIYTATSRVKESNDIRLLLVNKDWSTLNYIATLQKNSDIAQFFKGYPDLPNELVRWDASLTGVGTPADNNSYFH